MGLVQGDSDPYIWTTGQGCGYSLGGGRPSYNTSQEKIFEYASGQLYYIDEGESVGAIDRNLLMGGVEPSNWTSDYHLEKVSVVQAIYPALVPEEIVKRVQNCNRPNGTLDISLEDAEEVLYRFKEKFEDTWTRGWDDDSDGDIKFVGFFDGKSQCLLDYTQRAFLIHTTVLF